MSQKELNRLEIINKVIEKRLTQIQAAEHLKLLRRQICRLVYAYKKDGAKGLVSKHRGHSSNRQYPDYFREYVIEIIRSRYADFGPTLAAEKLIECHDITLAVETIRNWMLADGLWVSRRQQNQRVHQPRNRRDSLGELIQIDGSDHWWFEDRGPRCTLLVYIDDATSRLMHLKFVKSESTFDYFNATEEYLKQHGKPIAFYSDKHVTFRVNKTGATSGTGMTQFGRALYELNIDIICANTSQAKGRVERANKTLQDRLVKELRLSDVSTIKAANEFLPHFIEKFNHKFSKSPRSDTDSHRPFTDSDDLDRAMCWQEKRTVSQSLTIQYDKVLFLLEPTEFAAGLKRKLVVVHDYPDGRLEIRFEGKNLPYSRFDKIRQVKQGEITNNKRLGAVLNQIKDQQETRGQQRSKRAPKRQGQSNNQFAIT